MPNPKRLKYLYRKYIERTCSDEELEELFELLKDKGAWNEVQEVLRRNWDKDHQLEKLSSLDWDTLSRRMHQDGSHLTLSRKNSTPLLVRLSIAAGFLLILGIAGWYWMHREVMTIYKTGYGEVQEIVLNDDSHVRLNANSKLYWDSNWKRRGERNIRIEGEAFFDVAHREREHFKVTTPDLTVVVTGTSFNVNSRRNETEVYLETGKVSLELNPDSEAGKDETTIRGSAKTALKMVPGDQYRYSRTTRKLEQKTQLSLDQAASWKMGELIYKNAPLHTVLQELSDVYGKSFVVQDNTLFEKKIDVGMPYSDWETVKGVMQFMIGAEITENDNKVTIK